MDHIEHIKRIKKDLVDKVCHQMDHLDCVDTHELGCVIDMIKDCYEICKLHNEEEYYHAITEAMKEPVQEHHKCDCKEGKSHKQRKCYMEAREMHKDKATQLNELEKYMHELSNDIAEMMEGATPEEKQYIEKKIQTLAKMG